MFWSILIKYAPALWAGLQTTFFICICVWIIGLTIGLSVIALPDKKRLSAANYISSLSLIFSSIPSIVLLFWLYYPLQSILKISVDPLWTTIATLALYNTIGIADLTLKHLAEFPTHLIDAAKVAGLKPKQIILSVKLPIIIRMIMPGLITLQVNILHLSLFGSLISVDEIFRVVQRINSEIYRPVEVYSTLVIVFLLICLPLNYLANFLKNRFTKEFAQV